MAGTYSRFVGEFSDTEDLSRSLSSVDVHAVQLSKGKFLARLDRRNVGEWAIQSIEFLQGNTSCSGSSSTTRFAFLVPHQLGPGCKLLGKPLTHASVAIYSPSSEHADVSSAGLSEFILIAPEGFRQSAEREGVLRSLSADGAENFSFPPEDVALLRSILKYSSAAMRDGGPSPEVTRHFADMMERALFHLLRQDKSDVAQGRPLLCRGDMLRNVFATLERAEDSVLFQTEIARSLDVSLATLHRFFIDWFGLPPSRYLLIKRLYLARKRLASGAYSTVTDVATSCGFWEFGRFSARYREQFGELPSETLGRSGR